jgi:tRNA(Ile)-lysidine synthase TilS/MesJ
VFDFLGKIPDKIIVGVSGNKNSMVLIDSLSRYDKQITMLHVDFGDAYSKERIQFLKSTAKHLNLGLEIIQAVKNKNIDYGQSYAKNKALYDTFIKYSPSYVITANCLEDVIVHYIYSSIKINPKLLPYRTKNIIRPFINTSQEYFDYWALNKKVEYLKSEEVDKSSYWLIRKHMLDNCYRINPDLKQDILDEVNREFKEFIINRSKHGSN